MPQLNTDQQEKLSKIMSVPTKAATPPPMGPPVGQAVPVLPSYQVADLPHPSLNNPQGAAIPSATTVVGSTAPEEKKSSPVMGILLLVGGLILLVGYAYFWLIFFKIL